MYIYISGSFIKCKETFKMHVFLEKMKTFYSEEKDTLNVVFSILTTMVHVYSTLAASRVHWK